MNKCEKNMSSFSRAIVALLFETGLMKGILCDCRSFDKENTGKISEKVFKQIMLGKGDVSETDIDEMLQEYYR